MKNVQSFVYFFFLLVLLFLLFPLFVVISISIWLVTGSPIFFFQQRTGRDGKPFLLYKFRTMNPDAEKQQKRLLAQNEADGPVFKMYEDPRFTPIGKFLSHSGLDELPQVLNVFKGEMALIGPRPLPIAEAARLTFKQKQRQELEPGIISPWVFEGYHSQPFTKWMQSDVEYVSKKSFRYDCTLIMKAIPLFFSLLRRSISELVQ